MYVRFGKRVFDIIIALPALAILSPLMIGAAIWIKLDSKGSILFRQPRAGQGNVPFIVYKFRSMAQTAPSDMPTNDFKNADAYITRSGKVLRKLSIDELPQLLNVIKGDMSIVGPRPVVLTEKRLLSLRAKHGATAVKPGITGWAQINGRDELTPDKKAKLDGFYAKHVSFAFDVKCILMTVWTVVSLAGHSEGYESDANKESQKLSVEK